MAWSGVFVTVAVVESDMLTLGFGFLSSLAVLGLHGNSRQRQKRAGSGLTDPTSPSPFQGECMAGSACTGVAPPIPRHRTIK